MWVVTAIVLSRDFIFGNFFFLRRARNVWLDNEETFILISYRKVMFVLARHCREGANVKCGGSFFGTHSLHWRGLVHIGCRKRKENNKFSPKR